MTRRGARDPGGRGGYVGSNVLGLHRDFRGDLRLAVDDLGDDFVALAVDRIRKPLVSILPTHVHP